MAKFNSPGVGSKTVNRAGGEAYQMSTKEKLATILLTSFINNQFYRTENETIDEIKDLVKADPLFAAKASIYARNEYGMRSVSHVVAGEVFRTVSGKDWPKRYLEKVIFRADDISEIVSYYAHNVARNKPVVLPGQMKKGLASALTRFDEYQLGKYRGADKEWSLIDVVNLVRPSHTEAIAKLVRDELRQTTTVGAKRSAAKGDEEKLAAGWRELVENRKLGYMAALRNLNNIADEAPDVLDKVLEFLTNANAIHNSKVLPFQFVTALEALDNSDHRVKITRGINKAIETSLDNVPRYDGKTLVVIDTSGSMYGNAYFGRAADSNGLIKQASIFGACLAKTNEADVMIFSNDAKYINLNPDDSLITLANQITTSGSGGGTNFHAPFLEANRPYDRIVVLSDEQGWLGYNSPAPALESYKTRCNARPFVYMWDLAGLGTLQLPKNQIALLAGFSEKVFDVMKLVETDKNALVNTIEAIEI